ncbi:MAG: hypothetical protein WBG71_10155 [Leeuwenhoekiella sp.]
MNQFKSVAFLCLALLIFSCSDDDEATEVEVDRDAFSEAALEGTWDMTSFASDDATITAFVALLQNDITTDLDIEASEIDYQLTFDENNKVTQAGSFDLGASASILSGAVSVSEAITIDSQNTSFIEGNYEVAEDGFTVENSIAGDMKVTVTSFSENEMTITLNLAETNVLSDFGKNTEFSDVRLAGTATAVFERVQ